MNIYVRNCKKIKLQEIIDDKDGILSIAENSREIPFPIRRVYYIYGFQYSEAIRGMHAHKELEQVMFCISGSFKITIDDGQKRQSLVLDQPNAGLYLGPELWHIMSDFSKNCIILVFASDYYAEEDYMRDYDEFKKYVDREKK